MSRAFYDGLIRRGVRLAVAGDALRVDAPAGVLTPDDKVRLAGHKGEIMVFLIEEGGQSPPAHLTTHEVLEEMARGGSGAAMQAACYLRGEISEEDAIKWVSCAVLHTRREPFESWRRLAPAVREALASIEWKRHGLECSCADCTAPMPKYAQLVEKKEATDVRR